jgi:transposase
VFLFRGKRGDLLKALYWCDCGLCLFAKRLENGRFAWPRSDSGVIALTTAQVSVLLEGFDWLTPVEAARPRSAL